MGDLPVSNFKNLFDSHYPEVYRLLTYLLGNQSAAEDLAQETFLKLYQSPPREKENLAGWLFRVARNLAFNYLRSEKGRYRREERCVLQGNEITAGLSSEEAFLRKQEAVLVHEVLQKLTERDRNCLLLKFSGMSYAEIAEIIGVKQTSVGTVLARARANFKKEFTRLKGSEL